MKKKLISLILSSIMLVNFVAVMPINAFAASGDSKVYEKDGYTITYSVGSEWDNNQTIEVEISNTGEESILNWALKYDVGGSLGNLWNAKLYSSTEEYAVVKNNGYNYEIEPGQAVKYGYTLTSATDTPAELPDDIEMCNRRIEVESGYNVELKTTNVWDTGFQAEVEIKNTSEKPIEAWTLTFDSNFEINDYWNCKILDNNNGKYTIANKLWTTPIEVGSSATIGFTASLKEGEKAPHAENWLLTEVIVDNPTEDSGEEQLEFELIGFAEYNKETYSIIISWITEYESGSFDILCSDNGNDFNTVVSVKDTYTYEYKITEPFSRRYFKIVQTLNSGRVGESNALLVCKDENGYSMEFPDTDDDEVPDYLETAFGLDINKKDTDDDGLTDYEEMFLTGTDPTVYASVKDKVSDSNADSDNDGLSNKEEIDLGTDPVTEDTDNDGLSDGDEFSKYTTDPLKADTDDDGINDGDEIAMGLNPLDPNTYGVPDSEYTFDVDLSDHSKAMSEINTDNDYKLSIEIKAAGNVEKNIDVRESGYSETINNSAIVGKTFNIVYDSSCKTEKIVLKFDLNNEKVIESDNNIERFCVFKLFEDYNVILPVYTEYKSNENLVYAQVDEFGTYCLMDMEKLTQNIESNESQLEESIETFSLDDKPVVYANSSDVSWQNTIDKAAINVVFIMDIRDNIDKESFDSIKSNVVKAASEILKESPSAKIYLMLQHYAKMSKDNLGYTLIEDEDEVFFTDPVRIYEELDHLQTYSVNKYNKYCVLSDAIKYVFENCDNSKGTYCFSIFDRTDAVYRASRVGKDIPGVTKSDDYGYEVLKRLPESQIDVSIISKIAPEYNLGYAIDIYTSTGGIYIDGFSGFSDEVLNHIYGYIPNHDKECTVFYNGLNFEEMKLESEVTVEYLSAAEELGTKMQEILVSDDKSSLAKIRDSYSEYSDSDNDCVYDFEEIDVFNSLIDWNDNGKIILPTIEDYCNAINDKNVTKAMKEYIQNNWNPLLTINVMPIISDPMKPDTDGDGFVDYYENLYNKSKAVSTYSIGDENNNDVFIYNPISTNVWEPQSEVARLTMIGGYSYDSKQHIIYSNKTPIQRFFGFADTIDYAANPILSSAILCDPIYFYYNGLEYRLELWKGQYGIMAGAEVGLYYREPCTRKNVLGGTVYDDAEGTQKWYRAALTEDFIKVTYDYKIEDKTIFERDDEHWWTTGFKWGTMVDPEAITMSVEIKFKDSRMANACWGGGDIPSSVHNNGYNQTFGLNNAVSNQSKYLYLNEEKSRISSAYYSSGDSTITINYENHIIDNQPQKPNQIKTIQQTNEKFIDVYNKVKEYAGIAFNSDDIRFTNDPNYMSIDMWKEAFEETGYLNCQEYKAWKSQIYLSENGPESPAVTLINSLFGGTFSKNYSIRSQTCLINLLTDTKSTINALGINENILSLLAKIIDIDGNLDQMVTYGKQIANTKYYTNYGTQLYLYEYYPIWYEKYEFTLGRSISSWYYEDSNNPLVQINQTDYIYALNHVPGMAYSLMYILKNINSLNY